MTLRVLWKGITDVGTRKQLEATRCISGLRRNTVRVRARLNDAWDHAQNYDTVKWVAVQPVT